MVDPITGENRRDHEALVAQNLWLITHQLQAQQRRRRRPSRAQVMNSSDWYGLAGAHHIVCPLDKYVLEGTPALASILSTLKSFRPVSTLHVTGEEVTISLFPYGAIRIRAADVETLAAGDRVWRGFTLELYLDVMSSSSSSVSTVGGRESVACDSTGKRAMEDLVLSLNDACTELGGRLKKLPVDMVAYGLGEETVTTSDESMIQLRSAVSLASALSFYREVGTK